MKPINEYRTTNVFCITSGLVKDMAKAIEFFEGRHESVSAIAQGKEHDICQYTVRASGQKENGEFYLRDYKVRTICGVQIIDQIDIIK